MPFCLEITLQPHMFDAEGEAVRRKADDYFGIRPESVRTVHILTIDAHLAPEQLQRIREEIFTNPVTQVSAYTPLQRVMTVLRHESRQNCGIECDLPS